MGWDYLRFSLEVRVGWQETGSTPLDDPQLGPTQHRDS